MNLKFSFLFVLLVAVAIALYLRQPKSYNSVMAQSVHYFARPHEHVSLSPISAPSAWIGPEMAQHPERWLYTFTQEEIAEMNAAVHYLSSLNKSLELLERSDLALPFLSAHIPKWRSQISESGQGLLVLRGVPVRSWSLSEAESFFWLFGKHLGTVGAQDTDGQLLGHVRDTGANAATERQYKTNSYIGFHCDIADVVGLLCLRTALEGGESRLISSTTVFNELLKAPNGTAHVSRLFDSVLMDTRGSGNVNFVPVYPFRFSNGTLRTCYHAEYYRSAYRHPRAQPISAETEAALDAYDAVLNRQDLWLDMTLQEGDIQLVNNHVALHSRTAYIDHEDPAEKRHLLRLWLSLDLPSGWQRIFKEVDRVRVLYAVAYTKYFS